MRLHKYKDPETLLTGASPSFILRLSNEDELTFNFTCIIRQQSPPAAPSTREQLVHTDTSAGLDTNLAGLTYIFASNPAEIDQLTTSEFHADPNLHKNPNVELVGHYSTDGTPAVQFNWSWTWKPPKLAEDRGGGWRNTCSVRRPPTQLMNSQEELDSCPLRAVPGNEWLTVAIVCRIQPARP